MAKYLMEFLIFSLSMDTISNLGCLLAIIFPGKPVFILKKGNCQQIRIKAAKSHLSPTPSIQITPSLDPNQITVYIRFNPVAILGIEGEPIQGNSASITVQNHYSRSAIQK